MCLGMFVVAQPASTPRPLCPSSPPVSLPLQPAVPQLAVASVDASISGAAVEVLHCSLRRSLAAAALVSQLLAAPGTAAGVEAAPARTGMAKSRSAASLQRLEADRQALAAAASVAGSSSWVEVVALEGEQQEQATPPPSPGQQEVARAAVSVHYYDTTAAPRGQARSSGFPGSSKPQGAALRCSVTVGRLLLAHAPGLLTNLLLLAGQYSAGGGPAVAPSASGVMLGSSDSLCAPGDGGTSKAGSPANPAASAGSLDWQATESADAASSSPSLLAQALQPQLVLSCRVAQVEVAALSSQASEAAAVLLLLRELELRSGPLNWEAPWNNHLRHALLAPTHGEPRQPPSACCGGRRLCLEAALGASRNPPHLCPRAFLSCRLCWARPAPGPGRRHAGGR